MSYPIRHSRLIEFIFLVQSHRNQMVNRIVLADKRGFMSRTFVLLYHSSGFPPDSGRRTLSVSFLPIESLKNFSVLP